MDIFYGSNQLTSKKCFVLVSCERGTKALNVWAKSFGVRLSSAVLSIMTGPSVLKREADPSLPHTHTQTNPLLHYCNLRPVSADGSLMNHFCVDWSVRVSSCYPPRMMRMSVWLNRRIGQLTSAGWHGWHSWQCWVCVVAAACHVLCKRVNTGTRALRRSTLGTLKQVHNFLLHFHPWYIVGSLRDGQESRRKARSNESPPLVENLSGTCGSWSGPGTRGEEFESWWMRRYRSQNLTDTNRAGATRRIKDSIDWEICCMRF